ncbi:MAG: aldolase, partial [Planctomycetota bacterium]
MMHANTLRERLRHGGQTVGTMAFEFRVPGLGAIAAAAGADLIIFDMEHTGWTFETIRTLIAGTPRDRTVPMVRVPATRYHFIARALDMGARGIMVPMVESADQAREITEFSKYPPAGRRGAAFGIAHDDYSAGELPEKIAAANEGILRIAQIETADGLQQLENIAAVDGIDVLWVGQTDLTCSLGIPGQFEHPRFVDALKRVVEAAESHGKAAGYMA